MASIIPGYEYDIFISYRQKDNKGDKWVSEFVDALRTELESTFKEDISVYFDINPQDGLLETHDVDASLKDKLKCLIFIPIISRTYCDPKSYAWEFEFKAFMEQASRDKFGLKIKLPNGNVANRLLPIQIHDLYPEDKAAIEKVVGGVLRSIDFIYKESGVNRPLTAGDDKEINLNKSKYRNQINKVAIAIEEVIHGLKSILTASADRNIQIDQNAINVKEERETAVHNKETLSKKNIKRWVVPVLLVILCIACVIGIFRVNERTRQANKIANLEKSIAVLPFVNDSPDKENEYFCNGMMEEILNQLQKISDLRVKDRASVEKYRNPDKDIKVIGQELGVSLIMEGSVSKIGDDLRITAQLIDTKTGNHLWSEIYDGKYTTKIFEFRSYVAKKVAASLNAVITPQEEKRIEVKPTSEMLAYDLCSRGREMVGKFHLTKDSLYLRLAFNLFNHALKIDPNYIGANYEKGMTYTEVGKYDSAMIMFDKEQELDPAGLASAGGKGLIYLYLYKPDSALKYLKMLVDRDPKDLWVYLGIGSAYLKKKEVSKGLSYLQQAYNLGGNLMPEVNEHISYLYFYIGIYDKALKYIDKAIFLTPECGLFIQHCYILSAQTKYKEALQFLDSTCSISDCEQRCDIMRFHIYMELKEFKTAEQYYNQAVKTGYKPNDDDELFIACLYNETGRKKEALSILENVIKINEKLVDSSDFASAFGIRGFRLSAAYSMIGEKEKALKYLTYFKPEVELRFVLNNPGSFPGFDSLRSDPEFKAILQRIEEEKSANLAKVQEMEQHGEIKL